MGLIKLSEVSKIYNRGEVSEVNALRAVSLTIEKGGVVALTGPSGSGKTSLLSLIGCMARPTSGRLHVAGKDVVKLPERFLTEVRRERFGFIFQQFNLIRDLSVLENVLLPLYPLPISFKSMRQRALPILETLKITHKQRMKVKQLSGGEQQRVAIARALINNPEVLIADEPTAHLDRELAGEFLDIIETLNNDGKTVVIATHDPYVAESGFVTQHVLMRDGCLERVVER
ncbi:ABC transporter ATP-binding protein [Desulforhopalus sp. 52FAK]